MKTIRKAAGLLLCVLWIMGMVNASAAAEPKASEGSGNVLKYQAENLSWDGETITVKGYFINAGTKKDITRISSAVFSVKDGDGKEITKTSLNSGSLGEVKLAPGEQWSYTVIRKVSGFRPSDYNLKTSFQVSFTSDISVSSHGNPCSFCSSRGTPSFSTEDTMSQEEWEAMLAKLKKLVGKNGSSAETGSGTGFYLPPTGSYSGSSASGGKKICPKCSGTGSYICESCNGMGYKERQERMTCLIAHHTDCTYYSIHKCNKCHERHDIRKVKDKCLRCGGDGKMDCSQCFGAGTCY